MELTQELKAKFEAILNKCDYVPISWGTAYEETDVIDAMFEAYLLDRDDKIEKYLRQRIKELNDADAHFMEKAYDLLTMDYERAVYKNQSRSTTFGRQELESVLVFLKLPRFVTELPTPPNQ